MMNITIRQLQNEITVKYNPDPKDLIATES